MKNPTPLTEFSTYTVDTVAPQTVILTMHCRKPNRTEQLKARLKTATETKISDFLIWLDAKGILNIEQTYWRKMNNS